MSDRLRKVGSRFKMKFKTVTGKEFYGQLLDIPDTSRVTNFFSARRYLRVSPDTSVVPTDVVIINNIKYLIGFHGDGFHHEPIYRHYKIFQVDLEVAWQRQVSYENPVTGVPETEMVTQAGVVYLSVQPKSQMEDNINIPLQTYLALCNVPVVRGDILGQYVVTKVDVQLGLYVVEMKEK